jgi:Tol biopolymer transport system component
VPLDGSQPEQETALQLTAFSGSSHLEPKWSPEGRYLAYLHENISRFSDLVVIDQASGEQSTLSPTVRARKGIYSWADDERLFVEVRGGGVDEVFVDGSPARRVGAFSLPVARRVAR